MIRAPLVFSLQQSIPYHPTHRNTHSSYNKYSEIFDYHRIQTLKQFTELKVHLSMCRLMNMEQQVSVNYNNGCSQAAPPRVCTHIRNDNFKYGHVGGCLSCNLSAAFAHSTLTAYILLPRSATNEITFIHLNDFPH